MQLGGLGLHHLMVVEWTVYDSYCVSVPSRFELISALREAR
jgi:hypothetical protein